jgi:tRNA A-37 threonylcarbamoyl transferase component Bud32
MISAPPEIPGLAEWRPLAQGGFSTVWQARQESLNRLVAVKVDQRRLTSEAERRRFLREAGAAGRLSGHPGIVTVHDAGILEDNQPYLVMELCPGGSLSKWLKPENRPSQERVREVGVRIADALADAHARGVLHRDVKPGNILINSYGHPGLADFGLAAVPEPGSEIAATLEALTPAYAPREVIYGEAPTEFSDVYSLAATLYALLCGKAPRYPEGRQPTLLELIELQDEPIERVPGVDREFMDLLLKALSDNPVERPTAADFSTALAALKLPSTGEERAPAGGRKGRAAVPIIKGRRGARAAREPAPLEPEPRREPAPLEPEGRRVAPALLVAALVVILAAFVAAVLTMQPDRAATSPPITPSATASPTPSPTPTLTPTRSRSPQATNPQQVPAPRGFTDCGDSLGPDSFCVTEPECWNGIDSVGDVPWLGELADCGQQHIYQVFAGGQLPGPVVLQSQFEADKQVRRLCSEDTLAKVLPSGSVRKDWQIVPLPPQIQLRDDTLFRCMVSFGEERDYPIELKVPE